MACFLAPAAEAVVVTIVKKAVEKKEKEQVKVNGIQTEDIVPAETEGKISFSKKLGWLTNLLWGGSFLLLIEHIWHGEIVPWAPFLTAMGSSEDAAEMVREIATAGTAMAVLITVVWVAMVAVVSVKQNKMIHSESKHSA